MPGPSATDLVIFGASGDLTSRKILPALGRLRERGGLPAGFRIVGAGRTDMPDGRFGELVAAATGAEELGRHAQWVKLDYQDEETFGGLRGALDPGAQVIFYLATPPGAFSSIVVNLALAGLNQKGNPNWRLVVEKPLGHDGSSSRKLNRQLTEIFDEHQLFRIDHYLAKDTVQNVLAFRFSNSVFEPIWNRTLIDTIQVTAAEDGGIGERAGYYDSSGALRDVVQNHVLQLLALVTMEPPSTFEVNDILDAKLQALRAMRPLEPSHAVRGQYAGYLQEDGVRPGSRRETFAAARVTIDNWRWDGVPIYVRAGKGLRRKVTEVVIRFKDAPHLRIAGRRQPGIPTLLIIRIQPDEGVTLRIGAKLPGTRFEMVPASMNLEYRRLTQASLPDAYEHVLAEVLAGGHNVFPSGAEIDRSWELVDPLIESWEAEGRPELYGRGTWGPPAADELVATTGGGRWINSGDEPGT